MPRGERRLAAGTAQFWVYDGRDFSDNQAQDGTEDDSESVLAHAAPPWEAAFKVLRIHSETVLLLALAAFELSLYLCVWPCHACLEAHSRLHGWHGKTTTPQINRH